MLADEISQLGHATYLLQSAFDDTLIRLRLNSKIVFIYKKRTDSLKYKHVASESTYAPKSMVLMLIAV
jgi:hypothetical protein